ncbi:MAG: hypothetical protein ACMG57_02735 [Candidatus Dojkabacteria bacterium]
MLEVFDTTNAIEVFTDGREPEAKFSNWMKMLYGLELFIDFFDNFSPQEIELIKLRNIQLCEFINSLPKGSEQRIRITNQLRSLMTSLFNKGGNARIVFLAFPNIHEGDENQEGKRGKRVNDRLKPSQGW